MCDRYGGALAWDRHCAERENAYEAMRRSATCADCVHGHVFNGGVGDVWVCDADGTEEIERGATPSDSGCDWFEPR